MCMHALSHNSLYIWMHLDTAYLYVCSYDSRIQHESICTSASNNTKQVENKDTPSPQVSTLLFGAVQPLFVGDATISHGLRTAFSLSHTSMSLRLSTSLCLSSSISLYLSASLLSISLSLSPSFNRCLVTSSPAYHPTPYLLSLYRSDSQSLCPVDTRTALRTQHLLGSLAFHFSTSPCVHLTNGGNQNCAWQLCTGSI